MLIVGIMLLLSMQKKSTLPETSGIQKLTCVIPDIQEVNVQLPANELLAKESSAYSRESR